MSAETAQSFALGERVRIVDLDKPGHVRTPTYVRGKVGVIDTCCGNFENPENRALAASAASAFRSIAYG